MNPVDLAADISVITPERLDNLVRALKLTANLPGSMAEFGVYRGGSALVIAETCPYKILHLFDTYAGLPQDEWIGNDPEGYVIKGMFACDQAETERVLEGQLYVNHPGLFPATTVGLEQLQFSFVHVDCDLWDGAVDSILFFWPRIVHDGIIYFNDYGCKFTGVTNAVNGAFGNKQIVLQYEPSTGVQIGCYIVKEG